MPIGWSCGWNNECQVPSSAVAWLPLHRVKMDTTINPGRTMRHGQRRELHMISAPSSHSTDGRTDGENSLIQMVDFAKDRSVSMGTVGRWLQEDICACLSNHHHSHKSTSIQVPFWLDWKIYLENYQWYCSPVLLL